MIWPNIILICYASLTDVLFNKTLSDERLVTILWTGIFIATRKTKWRINSSIIAALKYCKLLIQVNARLLVSRSIVGRGL